MSTDLLQSWIDYHLHKDSTLFWAWETLNDLVTTDEEKAFEYIIALSSMTKDEEVLSNIGAGPLEELLSLHGERFIEQLEASVRRTPTLVPVVKCVWKNRMKEHVWERVSAIQQKYS